MAPRPPPTTAPSSGAIIPEPFGNYGPRDLVLDVLGIAGVGLLSYGAWLAFPPAGFMVAGVVLLAAGVTGARR